MVGDYSKCIPVLIYNKYEFLIVQQNGVILLQENAFDFVWDFTDMFTISNYIIIIRQDVITYPCPNFSGCLIKLPLK